MTRMSYLDTAFPLYTEPASRLFLAQFYTREFLFGARHLYILDKAVGSGLGRNGERRRPLDVVRLSDIADKRERGSVEWSPSVSCRFPARPSSSRSRRSEYRCTTRNRRRRRRRGEIMMSMPGRESRIRLSTFNHKTNSKT